MDEQIRAIEEYVYAKYIDPAPYTALDEAAAVQVVEAFYSRPDNANDPDCFYPGILYFELGFEDEERKVDYFRRAKFWLERHRALSGEDWDVVDDRLADLNAFFEERGIPATAEEPPAAPVAAAPVAPAPVAVQIKETEDHGTMVFVPAGPFLFGSGRSTATTGAYWIDKFPVTNRQYEAFCRATGYRSAKFSTDPRFANPDAPVVGVSVADALKYSRWVGKEIPTEEQWEKACRGLDGRAYPWGEESPSPEQACYGRDPETGGTDPVTAHPAGTSPFGAVDMSGNVWEWTSTTIPDGEVLHVVKGGCYNDPADLLRADSRLEAAPKDKYETIGFRCVKPA